VPILVDGGWACSRLWLLARTRIHQPMVGELDRHVPQSRSRLQDADSTWASIVCYEIRFGGAIRLSWLGLSMLPHLRARITTCTLLRSWKGRTLQARCGRYSEKREATLRQKRDYHIESLLYLLPSAPAKYDGGLIAHRGTRAKKLRFTIQNCAYLTFAISTIV